MPTGTQLRITGQAKSTGLNRLTIAVEAFTAEGPPVAKLDRDFILPNRREFLEKMGYEEIPAAFAGLIPD